MRITTQVGLLLIVATASVITMNGAEAAREAQAGSAASSNSRQASAQAPALTLDLLAQDGAKWIGTSPSQVRWSEDSSSIYFLWNPEAKDDSELYVIPREGGTPTRVAREQYRAIPPADAERNRDATMKVYAAYGDIFVITSQGQQVRRITNTEATERNPHFSFDGKTVTFERDGNLFQVPLDAVEEQQLTTFKTGPNPEQKPKQTELQKYLEKQQQDLFEYLRETERLERERKEFEKVERGPRPAPHYLKETERVSDLRLSPDGKFVTFILSDRSAAADAKVVEMPNYVTKSGFTEMRKLSGGGDTGRVKAGEPVLSYRLGVVTLADGNVSWVDHGQGQRAVNFNAPIWSADGRRAIAWAASVDHKDAWLLLLDLPAVSSRVIAHERDDAWVRGFRTGRIADGDVMEYGWMPDHNSVYFLSERDGFHHLYVAGLDGGQPRQLTSGKFELSSLQMSKDKKTWYFTSSEVHPGESHLYSMPLDGGARTRLTTRTGWYGFTLSPDEQHFALTFSGPVEPTELFVMANAAKAPEKKLTSSTKEEFRRHTWQAGEIVTFDDGEGHTIYADVWKPANHHPTRPAIIQVHGGGWSQGVYRRWSGNTPFFNYLAQEGYVVLNLDYRGSRGYGRDFRTAIYRHMGETEIKSAVAATDFLVKNYKVDRRRIGLFGGSYGGFFTLMALFKHPGMFAAGAVRAPVTDWAHYNHGYTTRILNAPYNDDEAYRRSSPIYLAEGLKDHLLIQHGVLDDNVHFQDSIRLAQRLLELKKDNWEFVPYPIENHGLQLTEYDRLDVMRRRVKLFNRVLKGPLPAPTATTSTSQQ
jgi:dipeptidyl aminopeptidase/acylaminoacyl peptidase